MINVPLQAYAFDVSTFSESGKILTVAHGGNTMVYPKYSVDAIRSAFECGADFVSVSVRKTSDGHFVLADTDELRDISSEGSGMLINLLPLAQVSSLHLSDKAGNPTECNIADLETVLTLAAAYDKAIIIDGEWAEREEIYKVISNTSSNKNAFIRTDAPKNEIEAFISVTNSMCGLITQYHGNILFTARNRITFSSKIGSKIVFLGTKNFFGSIFRSGVLSAFSRTGYSSRAAVKTYDPDESGNRPDCESTWSDVIDRGYSVIETDRIEDLINYVEKIYAERAALGELLEKARSTETAFLTSQSAKQLETAENSASKALITISSFDKLSLAKSNLNLALNNREIQSESAANAKKGVLNITAGKTVAIVLVTLAIIAVQIFFYFRQAGKKTPKWMKK